MVTPDTLYVANVGDSKGIIIRDREIEALNIEHLASNEEERQAVENRGGFVFEKNLPGNFTRCLVQGSLAITRSIGDKAYKKYISCEPDVREYTFRDDD